MSEFEKILNSANELFDAKKYSDAIPLFKKAYESVGNDKWLNWRYAVSLKKKKEIDSAISVCKETHKFDKNFDYNNNLLSWCLYEKYFKDKDKEYNYEETDKRIKISKYIIKNSKQSDYSAYENILFNLIHILKNNRSSPDKINLEILSSIDVEKLKDDERETEFKGKEIKYQSRKEEYYSIKHKSLFILKKYEACIECCNEALENIKKFHHNNDSWIRSKKAKSLCELGDSNTAINNMHELINKFNNRILLSDLAFMYKKNNDIKNAKLYFCRSLLANGKKEMNVNLYYEMGILYKQEGNSKKANKHFLLCKQIREENKWKLPDGLNKELSEIKCEASINLNDMKKIWLHEICSILGREKGTIGFIKYKTGSINSNRGTRVFFRCNNVINTKKIKVGDKVEFSFIDSFDIRKNKKTKEAAYIEIEK